MITKIKNINYLLSLLTIIFSGMTMKGQNVPKKKLTPDQYSLWSTLTEPKLSSNGTWASYGLRYTLGSDTVFVQQTLGNKKYTFPKGHHCVFSDNGMWWAVIDPVKGCTVLNLKTGHIQIIPHIISFQFLQEGKYLLLEMHKKGAKELQIVELETQKKTSIPNIAEYCFRSDGKAMAYITTENVIKTIKIATNFSESLINDASERRFKNLVWNQSGTALAFLEEMPKDLYPATAHQLYLVNDLDTKTKVHIMNTALLEKHEKSVRIVTLPAYRAIEISPDGQKVFFYIAPNIQESKDNKIVQVWDSKTPLTYPSQQKLDTWQYNTKLIAWWPEEDNVTHLGSDQFPKTILFGLEDYSLNFNPLQYEPQYEIVSPVDYVITNNKTGKSKTMLEKQSRKLYFIKGSGQGKYINYFKDKNWWVYNVKEDRHTNVSKALDTPIYDIHYDYAGTAPPYDSPGWSNDEKFLIVYDQYDIWLITPDGKSSQRITSGRENKIQYRISENSERTSKSVGNEVLTSATFDLSKGLLLEATGDNKSSGYFYWLPNRQMQNLVFKDRQVDQLIMAKKAKSFIYVEQTFELSPRLMFKSSADKPAKILMESNPQQQQYQWGQAELIRYTDSKGNPLQGILYYPSNFKQGDTYPMIVSIYEKQSHHFHKYLNPENHGAAAFPPMNYVLEGYLVLLPDITYELGKPGASATDCVLAAVKTVTEKGIVDQKRIGLTGISFGGYETAYIITQTDIFATAVAGSAATDFVSLYLSIEGKGGKPTMWRYESQQARMQKNLFDNYQGYIDNSPVAHAAKINTPLLHWSGKEDSMVNWNQGLELHLALRRLNKKSQFLVYPGEDHVLKNTEAKNDLNFRIKSWFDRYLKKTSEATEKS